MSTLLGEFPSNAYVIKVFFCGLVALALLIICGYHVIASAVHMMRKKKYDAHIIFSILTLIFAALSGIASFATLIEKSGCNLMLRALPLMYSVSKTMLYLTITGGRPVGFIYRIIQTNIQQKSTPIVHLYSLFLVILRMAAVIDRYTQIKLSICLTVCCNNIVTNLDY